MQKMMCSLVSAPTDLVSFSCDIALISGSMNSKISRWLSCLRIFAVQEYLQGIFAPGSTGSERSGSEHVCPSTSLVMT